MAALPVLVVVLVIAAITFWDKREQARMHRERARVPLVSAELRSQVGDAIADLLVATRRLHADVSELELSASLGRDSADPRAVQLGQARARADRRGPACSGRLALSQ